MLQLQERDKQIIDFITKVKAIDTNTITKLFFPSLRVAQNRLTKLHENGYLARFQKDNIHPFIYYIKGNKPRNLNHAVTVAKFLASLMKLDNIEVIKYVVEPTFKYNNKVIRPDLFVAYNLNDRLQIAFVEVELSKSIDIKKKYSNYYYSRAWKSDMPTFPNLIVVSDRTIRNPISSITTVQVNKDLSNISKLMNS